MKQIKIGVMGAHGCGKTSMAGEIIRGLHKIGALEGGKTVELVAETAREIPQVLNENMTIESQRWMFQEQVEREKEHAGVDYLVCDRTIVDPLVYAMWMAERTGDADWQMFVDARISVMLEWFNSYDVVFWMRPHDDEGVRGRMLLPDGVRNVDPEYQADIDRLFDRVVRRYGLGVSAPEECGRWVTENCHG